jgi:L-threonylcarbamoyladenylate synthase
MQTRSLTIDAAAIAQAATVLRRGGLVAFPTETVYGLGAHALDADAVARIFIAKGRPSNNPLIVHVAEPSLALLVVRAWPEVAARLAERFWPGPLTLVLPKQDQVPEVVTGGGPTVAVRVPAHPVAQALLRATGLPIAAPSANRSNQLSPTRAEHVLLGLDGRIDLVLDGGPTAGGIESTVLDVTTFPPRLLRPGLVAVRELEEVVGTVLLPAPAAPDAQTLLSPGMLPRHYAPRAALECVGEEGPQRAEELCRLGRRVGWVTYSGIAPGALPGLLLHQLPPDPVGYAAQLYATLHALDAAGVEHILVTMPPDTPDWLAVRDRLRRASS